RLGHAEDLVRARGAPSLRRPGAERRARQRAQAAVDRRRRVLAARREGRPGGGAARLRAGQVRRSARQAERGPLRAAYAGPVLRMTIAMSRRSMWFALLHSQEDRER